MKKGFYLISLLLLTLFSIIVYFIKPYYTPAVKQNSFLVQKHFDCILRIAYIGDSWAEGHMNIPCEIDSIIKQSIHRDVVVQIAGVSGLTSKNIYYSIFRNEHIRKVIEWGPDYCFVAAGINDSDRKMGKSYYRENMRLIINFLLEHHIIPIILEVPSFDICYSFKRRNRQVKMKYLFSMIVTQSRMDCINDYRKAYKSLLKDENLDGKVLTVWTKDWNPDGYRDIRELYDEGYMHLNEEGYHVLDSCIAQKIILHILGENRDY